MSFISILGTHEVIPLKRRQDLPYGQGQGKNTDQGAGWMAIR